jgi:MFS family permease
MFAGPSGDYLGRKKTIFVGALVFCLGGGLQTGAQTINYLYAGRCLAGVGYVYSVPISFAVGLWKSKGHKKGLTENEAWDS